MAEALLELSDVSAGYGSTVVIEGVGLKLAAGESLAVLGRNGVGKTTLLSTIMGHTSRHAGDIRLDGENIAQRAIEERALLGLGLVPQEREIFGSLTVEENLDVAAHGQGRWTRERLFVLFPQLAARRLHRGNELSGGEQQMLAIGRALMGNPRLLLMDEPSEGLAPIIVEDLQRAMVELREETGLAVILVEQNAKLALRFAPRALVMDRGRIVHDGASSALLSDPSRLAELMGLAGDARQ